MSDSPPPASIEFCVPGEPRGKARPRFRVYRGYVLTYTDTKTAAYERKVAMYAKIAMGPREPLAGPLAASMLFRYSVPKSFTKARRRAALAGCGPDYYLGRFDVDNLTKAIMDSLNGIVFNDDKQIVRLTTLKRPDADPGVDILVKPYELPRVA